MERQRRSFTEEYKRQAVELVVSSGRSITSVAGLRDSVLRRCLSDAADVSRAGGLAGGLLRLAKAPDERGATANAALLTAIRRVHHDSGQRYGSPWVHAVLRTQGRGASRGRSNA